MFPFLAIGLLIYALSQKGNSNNSGGDGGTIPKGPPAPGTANPNNNPGNIRPIPGSSFRFDGEIYPSSDPGFRQFKTIADGYAAMFHQLQAYLQTSIATFVGDKTKNWSYTIDPLQLTGNIDTLYKIINTYAPAGDNNDPATYIANVTSQTGIGPYDQISINNPNQAIPIIKAMATQEGSNPQDSDIQAGYNLYMGK